MPVMNSPLFFMLGCIWMPMDAQETSLESFNEKTTDEAHNLLSSFECATRNLLSNFKVDPGH